jgi:hypothetical protein
MKKIAYQGWPNCYRLTNPIVELIVTGDVGPRIIRFGFIGEENEFKEFESTLGATGGDDFRLYGGHRLWHAPEVLQRTYQPDNATVSVAEQADGLIVTQRVEPTTGIEKQIDIRLDPALARAQIVHTLTNRGLWPVELAPWALTMMAPGGVGIIPLPPYGAQAQNLLPVSSIAYWPYTNLADPRYQWGSRYVMLRQDQSAERPQKIGLHSTSGWLAYARHNHVFVKGFDAQPTPPQRYPDFGSTVEMFTDAAMLELETLGPLVVLAPGDSVRHAESWALLGNLATPRDEDAIDRDLLPLIQPLLLQGHNSPSR